ncbi:bifunctional heptose 7-phosphate kinase/heptose 1-phosphate adenyltransferase [Limisphaera sp. VF-2]|jgi:rfaE bifunctional protein kinase chain/domain|uniref:bifunctional heptose 7-phosphate kinase/heptose 1-phosphate adenyltransferase n=1 Tax=Limisphaera sp. VF-2 TaxID=3400418 RepID=UPI00176CF4FF|nr:PfkB family carbohydrate kinase [Limisphaera sp.]
MTPKRLRELTGRYGKLRIAVVGDFCLDRYLEIDPARRERSLETGLPVYNVVRVRAQPGAAGTIVNNLVAAGVGRIHAVGFCGEDGEGYELRRALAGLPGVALDDFLQTPCRRTFTYTKPLVMEPGRPPRELNRLDLKNWTPTPRGVSRALAESVRRLATELDAMILLDQVDVAGTGVLTAEVLRAVREALEREPDLLVLADSRRGLRGFPAVLWKMNVRELGLLLGARRRLSGHALVAAALRLAQRNRQPVVVTLGERGLLGAWPTGNHWHVPAFPVRGPIDVVGAGDAVSAHLMAALAAGATPEEALWLANAAASVVIHKLGTTGTATPRELEQVLRGGGPAAGN